MVRASQNKSLKERHTDLQKKQQLRPVWYVVAPILAILPAKSKERADPPYKPRQIHQQHKPLRRLRRLGLWN
jgi:hypothetical protein